MPPSKLVPVPAGSASGAGGMTPTGPEKPQRSYPSDQEPQAVTSKKSSNSRVRFQDPEVGVSPLHTLDHGNNERIALIVSPSTIDKISVLFSNKMQVQISNLFSKKV